MGRRFGRLSVLSGLALSVALTGCGGTEDELPREPISGTVTLDGQPLTQGIIQFRPASSAERVPAGAEIKEGSFAIPRDQGLTPGNYRVLINSSGDSKESTAAESVGEKVLKVKPDLIPVEYNVQTKLTAKVEAGKPNAFEFALNLKKKK